MRYLLGTTAAFGLLATVMLASPANACSAHDIECNRSSDGTTFHGDRQLKNTITVEVCHSYYHLIDVGYVAGRRTKWWAPVMVYNTWYGDLPEVFTPCKTYSVKPGTELRLFAECVQRVISTGRMYKSGTYYMT